MSDQGQQYQQECYYVAISEQMAQLSLITDDLEIEVLPGHNKKGT